MKKAILFILALGVSHFLNSQSGIKADYYDDVKLVKYAYTRIEPTIDKVWNDVAPVPNVNPHYCSIRWTGKILAPETGTYTFYARFDDGIRFWVNGVKLFEAWGMNDSGSHSGSVNLTAGQKYDLRVEYFNALFEGEIQIFWKTPNGKRPQKIDAQYLFQPDYTNVATTPPPAPEKSQPVTVRPKTAVATPPKPAVKRVKMADTIQKYTPKNVLFEQSKSTLLPASYVELDNLALMLKRFPKLSVRVEGHTDNLGNPDLNLTLSQERAEAVVDYLKKHGVAAPRLSAKGYGSTRPLVADQPNKPNAANRRVEFIIQ